MQAPKVMLFASTSTLPERTAWLGETVYVVAVPVSFPLNPENLGTLNERRTRRITYLILRHRRGKRKGNFRPHLFWRLSPFLETQPFGT